MGVILKTIPIVWDSKVEKLQQKLVSLKKYIIINHCSQVTIILSDFHVFKTINVNLEMIKAQAKERSYLNVNTSTANYRH